MTEKKQYDVLQLHAMTPSELERVAKTNAVDTLNKPKQVIIYEILDVQAYVKTGVETKRMIETRHALSLQTPQTPTPKKRVYLVAKITGLPYENVLTKYAVARTMAERLGYEAVVPTDHVPAHTSWHNAMRTLIPIMLGCDCYALVDESHTTAGGLVEDTIAHWVQLPKVQI